MKHLLVLCISILTLTATACNGDPAFPWETREEPPADTAPEDDSDLDDLRDLADEVNDDTTDETEPTETVETVEPHDPPSTIEPHLTVNPEGSMPLTRWTAVGYETPMTRQTLCVEDGATDIRKLRMVNCVGYDFDGVCGNDTRELSTASAQALENLRLRITSMHDGSERIKTTQVVRRYHGITAIFADPLKLSVDDHRCYNIEVVGTPPASQSGRSYQFFVPDHDVTSSTGWVCEGYGEAVDVETGKPVTVGYAQPIKTDAGLVRSHRVNVRDTLVQFRPHPDSPSGGAVPGFHEALKFKVRAVAGAENAPSMHLVAGTFKIVSTDKANSGWMRCDEKGDEDFFLIDENDPQTALGTAVPMDQTRDTCLGSAAIEYVAFTNLNVTIPSFASKTFSMRLNATGASPSPSDTIMVSLVEAEWSDGTTTEVADADYPQIPIEGHDIIF